MITTLFNLFCPMVNYSISLSLILLSLLTCLMIVVTVTLSLELVSGSLKNSVAYSIFPLSASSLIFFLGGFITLAFLNLSSLVCYSYPVTTTLSFNFSVAFALWLSSLLLMSWKSAALSSVLPLNSPWYLASFLSVVEVVSVGVRPITLCFRLLANMSAGHVLLTLICKMSLGLWVLGTLFGVLELMVSLVQAFVFMMLTTVYLEEAISH